MPFLYAYYSMLVRDDCVRRIAWITIFRLRPLYLLPAAVFISMFFVPAHDPQGAMDPQQQIMNIFMPLMDGYITSKLAAGLACTGRWKLSLPSVQQMARTVPAWARNARTWRPAGAQERNSFEPISGQADAHRG